MASLKHSKKKKKAAPNPQNPSLTDLATLGRELLSSRSHINNLPILLKHVSVSSPPRHALESLISLQSFFTLLLPSLPSRSKAETSSDGVDPEVVYGDWVRARFDEFARALIEIAVCGEADETLREVVLDSVMEFVKIGNGGKFYSALYHKLIKNIVYSSLEIEFLLELLASKYFTYIDVCYFTLISIEKISKSIETDFSSDGKLTIGVNDEKGHLNRSLELGIRKIHFIITKVPPLGTLDEKADLEMWTGLFCKESEREDAKLVDVDDKQEKEKHNKTGLSTMILSKKMRLKFTKAWLSFLRLPLPIDLYKEVLGNLHLAVVSHLSNPVMLCDFLTRSYDIGGVISVMALSSLFILMTQYGLEYSNFYEKLYALLAPSIFMAKHRSKFFQLLDSCLKSPLLPAYLAAAFTKKLSRLALSVPPSGALIIIALVHNLLRRHPSINCLVHRESAEDKISEEKVVGDKEISTADVNASKEEQGIDLFRDEECNPLKSNAMRSSLWEIDTLRHHYSPAVSRFVSSLEIDLTVRAKTSEVAIKDFSSASYATIFADEMRRRVKQVPVAFHKVIPTSLFSESDFPGWSFKRKGEANGEVHEDNSMKRQKVECFS
ncbi:hypothetical protein Droror1_Dr00006921 [Drosera rotundifolia]